MNKDDVLRTIRNWHLESINFRNDGWVQAHYKENIEGIKRLISSFESCNKNVNHPSPKEEGDLDDYNDVVIICDE